MKLFNLVPTKILSQQAKKPSGLIERYIMPILFAGNADLNILAKKSLELTEHDRVLEIGFGPGKLLNEMATIVDFVEGIDFSKTMVAKAKRLNKHHITNNKMNIQQGDCSKLPYIDNSFDKICSVNTLYFWEKPEIQLQEIFRVVKPEGKIILGFRNKEQMQSLNLDKNIFNIYTTDEIVKLLANIGFSNINIKEKDGKPFMSYCAVAIKKS
ncbi:class I SAM-dependent methyltransferase [Candidatus Halobeggiatoa sp. HSG11]|nr:class I SAM-dependent methyltransferase [Candidatus Halobeggiatoa sp. HSG11]